MPSPEVTRHVPMVSERVPRVAVLGMGVSGLAAARLLADRGYRIRGFDQHLSEADGEADGLDVTRIELGDELARAVIEWNPEFAVASPGIPEFSPLVATLRNAGVRVIGEVQLAWNLSRHPGGRPAKWLCVTGTNGKTTTVGMLASILESAGEKCAETGNVGYPITSAIDDRLESLAVELSSFQLATSDSLEPEASICLNIDSDHLDWHGSRERYAQAKARVYNGVSKARVFFEDEPLTEQMAKNATRSDGSLLVPLCFGTVAADTMGVDGTLLLDCAFSADGQPELLVDLDAVPCIGGKVGPGSGASNPLVRDAVAAAALARAHGVPAEAVAEGLMRFRLQHHRGELISEHNGVRWIDDSKATNVHAALAAARAVSPGTLIWIMGGDAKGQDLTPLVEESRGRAKAVVVIGEEQSSLLNTFALVAPKTEVFSIPGVGEPESWMAEVVRACNRIALSGDTVLLAPGCASWDQFSSFAQRGDIFASAAKELQVTE